MMTCYTDDVIQFYCYKVYISQCPEVILFLALFLSFPVHLVSCVPPLMASLDWGESFSLLWQERCGHCSDTCRPFQVVQFQIRSSELLG